MQQVQPRSLNSFGMLKVLRSTLPEDCLSVFTQLLVRGIKKDNLNGPPGHVNCHFYSYCDCESYLPQELIYMSSTIEDQERKFKWLLMR